MVVSIRMMGRSAKLGVAFEICYFLRPKSNQKDLAFEKPNHFAHLTGGAKKTRRSVCAGRWPLVIR